MKQFFSKPFFVVLFFILIAIVSIFLVSAQSEQENNKLEIPACHANDRVAHKKNILDTHQIVKHKGYTLCYRENYEQAEWVSYTLEQNQLEKKVSRKNNFRSDKKVITKSATPQDYSNSGWSKGHLVPARDMAYSTETMDESFLMSNISPQDALLNSGLWNKLEERVRAWTERFGKVYVVTGPLLEKENTEYERIGENKVCVPEYFYKVILADCNAQIIENDSNSSSTYTPKWIMIGFIMPNKKCNGTIWKYVVPVDEIETRTGLDFFYLLDDNIETKLEAECNTNDWR